MDARFWWHLAVHEPARSNQKPAPAYSVSLWHVLKMLYIKQREKSQCGSVDIDISRCCLCSVNFEEGLASESRWSVSVVDWKLYTEKLL